jgi:hypothetical protein
MLQVINGWHAGDGASAALRVRLKRGPLASARNAVNA